MSVRTWVEIGVHSPSTPGGPMNLDSFPLPTRNPYHVILGVTNFGAPTPIFALTQEEGVDIPFSTRYGLAKEPPIPSWYKRRQAHIKMATASAHGIGMPTTIFTAPPEETPMFVGRSFEIPRSAWVKRKASAQHLAALSTYFSPGVWSELIPATSYTAYSCRLLSEIQRHMLESTIDEGVTWSLWTQTEVLAYLNQRLAKFLVATGLITTRTSMSVGAAEVDLPSDLIDLRRLSWNGVGLVKVDDWMMDGGTVGWDDDTGTPYAYIEEPLSPLKVRLVPTPTTPGTLGIIYVANPATIGAGCVPLPIPNMFAPFIKYGVMADMFSKQGEANDPERAAYCESRFREGIELGRLLVGVRV